MTMTRRDWRQLGKGFFFISPWMIGFSIFTALPIILSFYYSLCYHPLVDGKPPTYVGINNYRELIWGPNATGSRGDPIFWKSLWNTSRYAMMVLPGGLIVSLGLALMLNARIAGQRIYRTVIYLPSLVPVVASAMLWMWLLNGNSELGLVNGLLKTVGIGGPNWLNDSRFAMPSLALMSMWGLGNTVVIYLAGLQDVPRELYEAAEIDGAGMWGRLWHVTLPMLSPVIFFNLVMALIGTLQVFSTAYIMNGAEGSPERSTLFYAMQLYSSAFRDLRMGYAAAMAWILFIIILTLTGIAFWSSKRWVHYQSK